MNPSLAGELRDAIFIGLPFESIWEKLVDLKRDGVSREDALRFLEELRSLAPDEDCEDRILDAMDILVGYCATNRRIWGN